MWDGAGQTAEPGDLEEQLRAILERNGMLAERSDNTPNSVLGSRYLTPYSRPGGLLRPDEIVSQLALAELEYRKARLKEVTTEATQEEVLKLTVGITAIKEMEKALGQLGITAGDDVAQEVIVRLFVKGIERIEHIIGENLDKEGG